MRSSSQDRTTVPRLHALKAPGHVGDDVLLLEQLVALGVGGHEAVLDAVVDHLRVVPRADLAGVDEALVARALGPQRVEDRHRLVDPLLVAAAHQAVAVLEAPDAAAHTAVDVADLLLAEQLGVLEVVGEAGVAAVDDEVTGLEQVGELGDGLARRVTGGHHDPHDAGGLEGLDQGRQRAHVGDVGVAVEADHLVARAAQPLAHVAAHLAETDETELHVASLSAGSVGTVGGSRLRPTQRASIRLRGPVWPAGRIGRACGGAVAPAQLAKRTGMST